MDHLLELEQQFHALRRLVASKAGYGCFTTLAGFREKVGWKVAKALKRNDDGISHVAIEMLCALMEPMHQDYDLRQEQLNKSSLLSSEKFLEGLLELWWSDSRGLWWWRVSWTTSPSPCAPPTARPWTASSSTCCWTRLRAEGGLSSDCSNIPA